MSWLRSQNSRGLRYSPLLTRMMNNRVESNVKQVIELCDSPEQPAQRTWVGLTDDEKRQLFEREDYQGWLDYINAIEAKLKEKNV